MILFGIVINADWFIVMLTEIRNCFVYFLSSMGVHCVDRNLKWRCSFIKFVLNTFQAFQNSYPDTFVILLSWHGKDTDIPNRNHSGTPFIICQSIGTEQIGDIVSCKMNPVNFHLVFGIVFIFLGFSWAV